MCNYLRDEWVLNLLIFYDLVMGVYLKMQNNHFAEVIHNAGGVIIRDCFETNERFIF